MKIIQIIGGGTLSHVRAHLAICAPAYGTTASDLAIHCLDRFEDTDVDMDIQLHLTKMADPQNIWGDQDRDIVTNDDVSQLVDEWIKDKDVKIIFFNVAMCDFKGSVLEDDGDFTKSGKYEKRLKSSEHGQSIYLIPAEKILTKIRKERKDIFLVAFKTTTGATEDEQYIAGLKLLKENSCNLVLANDLVSRVNMIITPEEARYHVSTDREEVLKQLVDMTYLRSQLTFTQSTVIAGEAVKWEDSMIPQTLRDIVEWCIKRGAYKEFNGATVGHFAHKLSETEFLTSIRKTNFNDIDKNGMVMIRTDGPDTVMAYGAKPSVGGQSQRIVFKDHPDYDCILHFHCPLRTDHVDDIPVVSQREYECGSHQCGENTSKGLDKFGNLSCVMLDNHGPNIVFHHSIEMEELTSFITANFNLSAKTGGLVTLPQLETAVI